jgi:hypothetical protein
LNILPVPKVEFTTSDPNLLDGLYTVTFDASDSFNDGVITLYKWDLNDDGDFDDSQEITTDPTNQVQYLKGQSFTVTVNVVGDVVDPETDELEVGSTTVEGYEE